MTSSQNRPLALVTGASRGIGAAIAAHLAQEGYDIVLNYQSNAARAEAVREKIIQQTPSCKVHLLPFDVAQASAVNAAFEQIPTWGTLEVLVNNAGISKDNLILRLKPEELEQVLQTNLMGAIYCSKEAAKLMMKNRKGAIIQISSVVGEMGNAGQVAYSAAKAGMIGFTKSLAKELASRSIRVNAITPGYIQTEMTEALNELQKKAITDHIPLGCMGDGSDVAQVVCFLANHNKSKYITGQVIGVNGGLYI